MTPDDWADTIFDVTGMILSREQAKAISDLIEARVAAAEAARDALLLNATNAALPALARADRAESERDRLRQALRFMVAAYPLDKFKDDGMRLSAHIEAGIALGDDA